MTELPASCFPPPGFDQPDGHQKRRGDPEPEGACL